MTKFMLGWFCGIAAVVAVLTLDHYSDTSTPATMMRGHTKQFKVVIGIKRPNDASLSFTDPSSLCVMSFDTEDKYEVMRHRLLATTGEE